MPVLRWTNRNGRLVVTEHDTLDEAARAQTVDDQLGVALERVEQITDEGTEIVPTSVLRDAQPAAPLWRVIVRHPAGSALASVHEGREDTDADAERLGELLGADRVDVALAGTL